MWTVFLFNYDFINKNLNKTHTTLGPTPIRKSQNNWLGPNPNQGQTRHL